MPNEINFLDKVKYERVAVSSMKPAPYNPRVDMVPGNPEYDSLVRSVELYGLIQPIIWNRKTGHVLGGNQRLKVIQGMGVHSVACAVVEMVLVEEMAANVALNKITGEWEMALLHQVMDSLNAGNFDLRATGFDDDEVEKILAGIYGVNAFAEETPAKEREKKRYMCPCCGLVFER